MSSLLNLNYKKSSKITKVVIGTPSIDGKLEALYVDSLVSTIRECQKYNIEIYPIFLTGESILHMARNKIISVFYKSLADILIFIDADQVWEPKTFIDVVNSNKSAFGVAVPLKTDDLKFNVGFDLKNEKVDQKTKDFTVVTIGTGFFKLDRKIVQDLWDSNDDIIFKNEKMKMIFEYTTHPSLTFIGEDYYLCDKIRELGYDVWTNMKYISHHIGTKIYKSNFQKYREKILKELNND